MTRPDPAPFQPPEPIEDLAGAEGGEAPDAGRVKGGFALGGADDTTIGRFKSSADISTMGQLKPRG